MTLILLNGLKQSGKSTAGGYLSDTLGFDTYAFAKPLKAVVNGYFGLDERHAEGELKEVVGEFPVPGMLKGGTILGDLVEEHMPMFHQTLESTLLLRKEFYKRFGDILIAPFISLTRDDIGVVVTSPRRLYQLFGTEVCRGVDTLCWLREANRALNESEGDLIITDCRFLNEATWGRNNDGYILEVVGGRSEKDASSHASEQPLPPGMIDRVIDNTLPGLKNLYQELDLFIDYLELGEEE